MISQLSRGKTSAAQSLEELRRQLEEESKVSWPRQGQGRQMGPARGGADRCPPPPPEATSVDWC